MQMRDKLEEQLNQERINLRKKEDEMEKTQMDQRLRYRKKGEEGEGEERNELTFLADTKRNFETSSLL